MQIFDKARYPYLLTQKGQALITDYTIPPKSASAELEREQSGDCLPPNSGLFIDLTNKRSGSSGIIFVH